MVQTVSNDGSKDRSDFCMIPNDYEKIQMARRQTYAIRLTWAGFYDFTIFIPTIAQKIGVEI